MRPRKQEFSAIGRDPRRAAGQRDYSRRHQRWCSLEKEMKFESQVVHAGDRKRCQGRPIPSTTPITLGTTYFYDSAEKLDRVLGLRGAGIQLRPVCESDQRGAGGANDRAGGRGRIAGKGFRNVGAADCVSGGPAGSATYHSFFGFDLRRDRGLAGQCDGAVR